MQEQSQSEPLQHFIFYYLLLLVWGHLLYCLDFAIVFVYERQSGAMIRFAIFPYK